MRRISGTSWLGMSAWTVGLVLLGLSPSSLAQDVYGGGQKPSFGQSVKQSISKVGEVFTPNRTTETLAEDDPTSINSKAKPGVNLYLSIAQLYEKGNKPREAEEQYQKALKENPTHIGAMLGYARFLENQERFNEALNFYPKIIKAHPKNASVHNNLGLCYARMKKLNEAATSLGQAVKLDPKNPLYRNNISAVLVEMNRLPDAFAHLREVHGDAVAYYNMGYLLNKKGDTVGAQHHFAQSLKLDPSLSSAQRWLSYLQNSATAANTRGQSIPAVSAVPPQGIPAPNQVMQNRVANRPVPQPAQQTIPPMLTVAPQKIINTTIPPEPVKTVETQSFQDPPLPPGMDYPTRLPPVNLRQPSGMTPLPSTKGNRISESAPVAPLPPEFAMP